MTLLAIGLGVFGIAGLLWFVRRYLSRGEGGVYGTIEGFVGRPGQGKTTLAVQWAIARAVLVRRFGREVVIASNITIRAPEGIATRRLAVGSDGFDVVELVRMALELRARGGALILVVDEASICMPSRMWRDFGVQLMWLFQQSRHLHIEVVWTAQSETFVDSQLRQLTAATHSVRATPPATVVTMLSGKRPMFIGVDTWDRTAVGVVDAWLGGKRVRYQVAWESAYDTEEFVLPPDKLQGADRLVTLLREALEPSGPGVERPLSGGEAGTAPVGAAGRRRALRGS